VGRSSAARGHVAHGAAGGFPSDRGRGVARREMSTLHHAIRLEQQQITSRTGHRRTIVADPGHHPASAGPQGAPQAGHQRILPGRFHRKNRIAVTETALKTACMIIGTISVPDFS
jgi:hypothetical protein